ncbi:hypothetical protein SLA2020_427300 [Shorea laevis]
MGQWAELPWDLVRAISEHLKSYVDYVRVGAVCSSWNSALPKRPTHQFNQIPWLMLPFDDETQTLRSFYSIIDDKVYHLELSETSGKWFRGSCYGWLVTVEMSPALHLFNPLTKIQIALPPLHSFPDIEHYCPDRNGREYAIRNFRFEMTEFYDQAHMQEVYIEKLVLSSPPHDDYLAIAIFGEYRRLAFCSRNDKKWTAAETGGQICFRDIIFYNDKIYALTSSGKLLISDTSSLPKFTFIPVKLPNFETESMLYLVGSSNGLMMVERYYMGGDEELDPEVIPYKTSGFKIYLLESNLGEKMPRWVEIKHLGDKVMFLGYNASVLIPSIDFPKLKGNCIYYTDDQMELWLDNYGGFDIGLFDLEEGVIKEFGELNLSSRYVWPPPVWVMPNP